VWGGGGSVYIVGLLYSQLHHPLASIHSLTQAAAGGSRPQQAAAGGREITRLGDVVRSQSATYYPVKTRYLVFPHDQHALPFAS
jgi:hypothetical protein